MSTVPPLRALSSLPGFDTRQVPVTGVDTHLPAVARSELSAQALRERFDGRIAGWIGDAHPQARGVARLAVDAVRRGDVVAPELAAPLYVRNKVALTTAERLAKGGRT